eukprot:gene7970-9364_t
MTGSWTLFAAGAIAAKTLGVIEGGWRYVGPALFPGVEMDPNDVKHMARWTPPHFCENVLKNKDLKMVPDGGVVFWSRYETIPKRNVTLDVKDKDTIKLDQAITFVSRLGKGIGAMTDEAARLTELQENALIDLLLEKDDGVLALYRCFHMIPSLFKYHALRYLTSKGKLITADVTKEDAKVLAEKAKEREQKEKEQKEKEIREREAKEQTATPMSPTQAPSPHELTNTV